MRTSIVSFDDRARKRLQHLVYHAMRNARTDEEAAQVERLVALVRTGDIPLRDATDDLHRLRASQQRAA